MTPAQFLRAVWPDADTYCLATPVTYPGSDKTFYRHHTFSSIEAAASFAERTQTNVFFAVHALKEPRRWNPDKLDRQTGEKGAWEVRTQANADRARCFFFDLDVGAEPGKYASAGEAAAALKKFCQDVGLPKPLIVLSGRGLHVYWLLEDAIESEEWKVPAARLRAIAKTHDLRIDPARTTDTASVLRVVGTINAKPGRAPLPVRKLVDGVVTPNAEFLKLLKDASIRSDISLPATREDLGLGSNLKVKEFDRPPPDFWALMKVCQQAQNFVRTRVTHSEPYWRAGMGLVRHTKDGEAWVHKISKDYPGYTVENTEAKLERLRSYGPTSCKTFRMHSDNPGACDGCTVCGNSPNPLEAARKKSLAPPPKVQLQVGAAVVEQEIPEAPEPYLRLQDGRVAYNYKDKQGDQATTIILEHDFYPLQRRVNGQYGIEQHRWCAVLPRQTEAAVFDVDADALYDRKKLLFTLSNNGVFPKTKHIEQVQDYMVAYIAKLQKELDAEAQCNHLGWTNDLNGFILPDKIVMTDGTAKPVSLSQNAARASTEIRKAGTLERQVELLNFYNDDRLIPHQYFILSALAAAIFRFTDQNGMVINAAGESGASKSSALYTGAGFWGHPKRYTLDGTNRGNTSNFRSSRMATLANLPICVDEITHMPVLEAQDLVMSVTQPQPERGRLNRNGVERAMLDSHKATIMMSTANRSLHDMLSTNNVAGTAGSMRVFEMIFSKPLVQSIRTKCDADDYLHELYRNYGHIGEVFLTKAVANADDVERAVTRKLREIDTIARMQGSERFWSANGGSALIAGEIAYDLGLVPFNIPKIQEWLVTQQIPYMRSIVRDEYTTPLGALADYLEAINADMIVMRKPSSGSDFPIIMREPRGQLLAHYQHDEQTMFLLRKGFRDYCARIGLNFRQALEELFARRIIRNKDYRKVLGAGTQHAKAGSHTIVVDMAHKEVSGALDVTLIAGNPAATKTPPKGHLEIIRDG